MSIHIDLLIPSFSVPFARESTSIHHPSAPLEEHELKDLLGHCSKAFGVDGSEIDIFKMVNYKKDVRIGCFITGSSKFITTSTAHKHTMAIKHHNYTY
jgi:hypothetical protein